VRPVGLPGTIGRRAAAGFLLALLLQPIGAATAWAQGVGDASWTPHTSTTTSTGSRFLVPDDALIVRTEAVWDEAQADGLAEYQGLGLRYTHEANDRSGRLSATGYWATNHPDPAFDRDDDDEDGRWEEAEIVAGARRPEPGRVYTTLIQFSRWHGKPQKGACEWAWDRRLGEVEVLSQLSRELLGEWQAERYTMTYESLPFPRTGLRPTDTPSSPRARCDDARPGPSQAGVVVTFAAPLSWADFEALPGAGTGRWTAFEAVGTHPQDDLTWTCGGPAIADLELQVCRDMGVTPDGVVAAVGYFDGQARDALAGSDAVARVGELQDALTGLLYQVGGFGVVRPGVTVNDAWWEITPAGR
jgi:hypothetical protein